MNEKEEDIKALNNKFPSNPTLISKDNKSKYSLSSNSIIEAINNNKIKKKKNNNTISSYEDMLNIYNNINIIIKEFLSEYKDCYKKDIFNKETEEFIFSIKNKLNFYSNKNDLNYIKLIRIMSYFENFNLFKYLKIKSVKKYNDLASIISLRNNLCMKIIINTKLLLQVTNDLGLEFFNNFSFLSNFIEQYTQLYLSDSNYMKVYYDIEVFFFTFLEEKKYGLLIQNKFEIYFNNFIRKLQFSIENWNEFINKLNNISSWQELDIIAFKRIIIHIIKRHFFDGLKYMFHHEKLFSFLIEGRLWKYLCIYFSSEEIFELYNLLDMKINLIEKLNLIDTIKYENSKKKEYFLKENNKYLIKKKFKSKLDIKAKKKSSEGTNVFKEEDNKLLQSEKYIYYKLIELDKEVSLPSIIELKNLFEIFLEYDESKMHLTFFIEKIKHLNDKKSFFSIFELFIKIDEEVTIKLLENSQYELPFNKWYPEMALVKQYFKLCVYLIKLPEYFNFFLNPDEEIVDYQTPLSRFIILSKNKLLSSLSNYRKKIDSGNMSNDKYNFNVINNSPKLNINVIHPKTEPINKKDDHSIKNTFQTFINFISKPFIFKKKSPRNLNNNLYKYHLKDHSTVIINSSNYKGIQDFDSSLNKLNEDNKLYNLSLFNKDKNEISKNQNKVISKTYIYNKKNILLSHSEIIKNTKKNEIKMFDSIVLPKVQNNKILPITKKQFSPKIEEKNLKIQFFPDLNSVDTKNKGKLKSTKTMENLKINNISHLSNKSIFSNNSLNMNLNKYNILFKEETNDFIINSMIIYKQVQSSIKETDSDEHSITWNKFKKKYLSPELQEIEKENNKKRNKDKEDNLLYAKIEKGIIKVNLHLTLIEHLVDGENVYNILCILKKIPLKFIDSDYYDLICDNLSFYTRNNDSFYKCVKPLITLALAAELLLEIGKTENKLKYKTNEIVKELLFFANCIQKSIKDDETLYFYLVEQYDVLGRNALSIYAEKKFYDVLNNQTIDDIVKKIWYGNTLEQSTLRFFRNTRILFANIFRENYLNLVKDSFFSEDTVYPFQFEQYINSCSIRSSFSFMMIIINTILYQSVLFKFVHINKNETIVNNSHSYERLEMVSNVFGFLDIINLFLSYILFYKNKRKIPIDILEFLINIFMAVAIVVSMFNIVEKVISKDKQKDTYYFLDGINYSVLILCSWLKVFIYLLRSNLFGTFVRVIESIFWNVFCFLLIFFCITFLFAQCFALFFLNVHPDFVSFYDAFVCMFNTAFGQVDFTLFKGSEMEVFGYIVMMAYTTLSNVMLFNLIVAIINNLFDKIEDLAIAEKCAILITSHDKNKWDNKYGILILFPAPFNIFTILVSPIILFSNNPEYYNLLFSKIGFFFLIVLYFIIYLVIQIILFPFVYLVSIAHYLYDLFIKKSNDYEENVCSMSELMFTIAYRPIELMYYLINDIKLFWKMVFKKKKNDDASNKSKIKVNFLNCINSIRQYLLSEKKKKKTYLSLHDLKKHFKVITTKTRKSFIKDLNESQYFLTQNFINMCKRKKINDTIERPLKKISNSKEYMRCEMRILISIFEDDTLNIEKVLAFFPPKLIYSEDYLKDLSVYNLNLIYKGLYKYIFFKQKNDINALFSKLELLLNILYIKFTLLYETLKSDKNILNNIDKSLKKINSKVNAEDIIQIMHKFEENEDNSDLSFIDELANEYFNNESNELVRHSYTNTNTNTFADTNSISVL